MSIDLSVDGSPASSRATALEIRELAGLVDAAGDVLARSMTRAAGSWTGGASEDFASVARERIHRSDRVHGELLRFATGLEGFAAGLTHVKAEMKRARAIAVHAGVPVATLLPEVGEVVLEPGQEGPLDHAIGVATRARQQEVLVQSAWQECLDRVSAVTWEPFDVTTVGKAASPGPGLSLGPLKRHVPDLDDLPLPAGPISGPAIGLLQGGITLGKEVLTRSIDAGTDELRRRHADGSLERDIRRAMYIDGVVVVTGVGAALCIRRFKGDPVKVSRCVQGAHAASKKFGKAQGDAFFWVVNRAAR